jgi:hypothetical protein
MNGHLGMSGENSDTYKILTLAFLLFRTFIMDVSKDLLTQEKKSAVGECNNCIRVSAFVVKSSKYQYQVLHIVVLTSLVFLYSGGRLSRIFQVTGVKYSCRSLFLQIYR